MDQCTLSLVALFIKERKHGSEDLSVFHLAHQKERDAHSMQAYIAWLIGSLALRLVCQGVFCKDQWCPAIFCMEPDRNLPSYASEAAAFSLHVQPAPAILPYAALVQISRRRSLDEDSRCVG
eukprot:1157480-Pelagomonas_calceolata.AAC.4